MSMTMFRAALKTMRPQQWVKNVFLLAGIIFSGNFGDGVMWIKIGIGILIYSLLAGCVYVINDIMDIERDKVHPKKRFRPIPSGQFPVEKAITFVKFFVPLLLVAALILQPYFFLLALFYFVMNIAYSLKLKHMIIFDVLVIAIGFVIRALAGAVIVEVRISPWLFMVTLYLALFLALSKRRHELRLMEQEAGSTRVVLKQYTPELVDQMISVVTASAVISYSLYTISSTGGHFGGKVGLEITIPFVIFGIFRYLFLVMNKDLGGSPERIVVKDPFMLANLLTYIGTVCVILAFGARGL